MSEAQALFSVLRQSADPDAVSALERLVQNAPDYRLARINALDFAKREGLDEERTIAMFLHASRIGVCELAWNVLCPDCGGGLGANAPLQSRRSHEHHRAPCAAGHQPTLGRRGAAALPLPPR